MKNHLVKKVITNVKGHRQTVWVLMDKNVGKKGKKPKSLASKITKFILESDYDVYGYMRGGVQFDKEEMQKMLPSMFRGEDLRIEISRDGQIKKWKAPKMEGRKTPKFIDIQGYQSDALWQVHVAGKNEVFAEQFYNKLFPTKDYGDDVYLRVDTKTGKIANWTKISDEKLQEHWDESSSGNMLVKAENISDDVLVMHIGKKK